jgi:type IV secretory pathway VirB10-like protein
MTCVPVILADNGDGLGGLGYFVALAVVAIIAALSKALQARAERQREAEANRRIEEARRQRQQAERGTPAHMPAGPQRPAPPAAHTPYAPAQRPAPRPVPPPIPPVLQPVPARPEDTPHTVAEELERQRRRRAQQERHRQQRLAAGTPGAQPVTTLVPGLAPGAVGRRGDALPPAAMPHAVALGPVDVAALRQAVIYREILSPPKALRREPESWEL